MIKYTCKSVVDNRLHKTAHHFPPYHIGNRLEAVRFQGGYPFKKNAVLQNLQHRIL